jgi:DNA-binding HxlR family transcriptional regulator
MALKPGQPARGSRTGRSIMVLLDLLGRRWTLRIIWELRDDSLRFRVLREKCDRLSPTMLNKRLGELRAAGIVELGEAGYSLTSHGKDLLESLAPLSRWAERWKKRMNEQNGGQEVHQDADL